MAKHLFIIGAQRSCTTYLFNILDEHPEVCMAKPVKPEPKYFMNFANGDQSYNTYHSKYFINAGNVSWLGEKSTSYIESEEALFSIKRLLPDATILVMLRNPVERAISNYCFTRDHGLEPYDFERALQEERSRIHIWHKAGTSVSPYAYTERGKYTQYLDRWSQLFKNQQFVPLVAEQIVGNQAAIAALYKQFDINSQFIPSSLMDRVNSRSESRANCIINEQLRAALQDTFRPWNHLLKMRYGLDVSCWEKEEYASGRKEKSK